MSRAWRIRATASVLLLPVPSPSRLKPPPPSPATLTLSPVRPSVTYSMNPPLASATSGAGPSGQMRRIQPDPDQMAEEAREAGAVGFRQWRSAQRGDVGAQMLGIAGSEQLDIDPGLVPRKAIGGVDDALGTALVNQKAERIIALGEPSRDFALSRQLLQRRGQLGPGGRRCCAPRTSAMSRPGIAGSAAGPPCAHFDASCESRPLRHPTPRRPRHAGTSCARDRA